MTPYRTDDLLKTDPDGARRKLLFLGKQASKGCG